MLKTAAKILNVIGLSARLTYRLQRAKLTFLSVAAKCQKIIANVF